MDNKLNFINDPLETPENVTHKTFFSELIKHEIGYNIYLPYDYTEYSKNYSVLYHLHGWKGNESSDIWNLEKIYRNKDFITVFVNGTSGYLDEEVPMESIIITELIPFIDKNYRTNATRENRLISGFSMGGAGAFYYAVKYFQLFGSVIAYAGTYHHFFHKGSRTVGEPIEKANDLFEIELKYIKEEGIFNLIMQNIENIRNYLNIKIIVGKNDVLLCDNEILHLFLNSLNIPHEYRIIEEIDHELGKIIERISG